MSSIRRVEQVFDNRTPSLPEGPLAYVQRTDVVESVREAARKPYELTVVCGHIGVGKTSVVRHAVQELCRCYGTDVGFRHPHYLSFADFSDGFSAAIAAKVGRRRREDYGLDIPVERPIQEVTQWLDEAQAIVVLENAQCLEGSILGKLVGVAKFLADFHLQRAKLVLVAAASEATVRGSMYPAIRAPIGFVTVPPWTHEDLSAIVLDGARKCDLTVCDEVVTGIAGYSLGIPAATHLLARKVFEKAVIRRATGVSPAHFAEVLRDPAHLERLSSELLPDSSGEYVRAWRRRQDPLIPAITTLVGARSMSVSQIEDAFEGLADRGHIRSAIEEATQIPLGLQLAAEDGDEMWRTQELLTCITALFELTSRSFLNDANGRRAERLLDRIMNVTPRPAPAADAPAQIFMCYSHDDVKYEEELHDHLTTLPGLVVWDDRRITASADWRVEIARAIETASAAVLIISASFLNSEFIRTDEVPRLLERRLEEGLRVIPVIARSCNWQSISWLARIQVRPAHEKTLADLEKPKRDREMAKIAKEILDLCNPGGAGLGR